MNSVSTSHHQSHFPKPFFYFILFLFLFFLESGNPPVLFVALLFTISLKKRKRKKKPALISLGASCSLNAAQKPLEFSNLVEARTSSSV